MKALALVAGLTLVACSGGTHDADCPVAIERAKADTALQFVRGELTQAAYDSKLAAFKALCEIGQ